MTAFNTTRTLRRMFNGSAYLDRAAPRFAPAKFLAPTFVRGLFIEFAPRSNCPGRISWPGRSALASRFLAFCAAFAFARWRALALVMTSSLASLGGNGHKNCADMATARTTARARRDYRSTRLVVNTIENAC